VTGRYCVTSLKPSTCNHGLTSAPVT
jgi:hypothetical protein